MSFCDKLTKAQASSTDVMIELSCRQDGDVGGSCRRSFLLGKRVGRPKFQLWLPCDFLARNGVKSTVDELPFPYEVDIRGEPARICKVFQGSRQVLAVWTSDEVSLHLARLAPWSR